MSEPAPSFLAQPPDLRWPDPATPLHFTLPCAQARRVRHLLGLGPHDAVRGLIDALEQVMRGGADPLVWTLKQGEYLHVLDALAALPFRLVRNTIYELARQAEPQQHGASHLEVQGAARGAH